ncbi:PTS sugar transporter subunit IIB [[Clostridium] spiroforme]|nr:PTS sugar transporter subunit IIB [Thomasclavelia spiroformis]MBM6880617.1 PTS sugar transporter subunit IIB [Thomasclavelia spiroformis]MBM6931580.1 PTS sugar transporter subunit IIB [Thomasclavelia spiroformis]
MKRFYLFCSAGMSTSMLASKMQKVADDHKLPIEVKAFPDGKIDEIVDNYHPDVILLGPQVKYKFDEINAKYGSATPVQVIDQQAYGVMDGEKVLKSAIRLIKQNKK